MIIIEVLSPLQKDQGNQEHIFFLIVYPPPPVGSYTGHFLFETLKQIDKSIRNQIQ